MGIRKYSLSLLQDGTTILFSYDYSFLVIYRSILFYEIFKKLDLQLKAAAAIPLNLVDLFTIHSWLICLFGTGKVYIREPHMRDGDGMATSF